MSQSSHGHSESDPASSYIELDAEQRTSQPEHAEDNALDALLGNAQIGDSIRSPQRLAKFLASDDTIEAAQIWLGRPVSQARDSADSLARKLNRDVGVIDELLNQQINEVLHHPRFQKLEASWRGLEYLHQLMIREQEPSGTEVKIKILDASWQEVERDFDQSFNVEQSCMFRKVYEEEFGQAGGQPFGLLIGDYDIKPPGTKGHKTDDFGVLSNMADIAASAFCPFITNASPELFEVDHFGQLEEDLNHRAVFDSNSRRRWKSLCEKEDARFIGMAMPKMLMRVPYHDRPDLAQARQSQRSRLLTGEENDFCFREDVGCPDSSKHLWGGAAFGFAAVVIRSFCRTGWLSDIRGVQRGVDGGGLLVDLPVEHYKTDSPGVVPKFSTDVAITDELEKELSELGFIPLCSCYDTGYSAFYSARSIQIPDRYDDELATTNAHISSMIYSMLCVSRFAHYLKMAGRDMVGRSIDAAVIERELHNWIMNYVTPDAAASAEVKSRQPLFDAEVQVLPIRGKSGVFRAVFKLQPHYEIEGLSAGIRLVTEFK